MSEAIKWAELTPAQRDELVAEKVMGWTRVQCPGDEKDVYCNEYSDYVCSVCGAYAPRNLPLVHGIIPPEHSYSQSLDAAWKVVEKMKEPDTDPECQGNYTHFADLCDGLEFGTGSSVFDVLWHLTSERICLAALNACGVEIADFVLRMGT